MHKKVMVVIYIIAIIILVALIPFLVLKADAASNDDIINIPGCNALLTVTSYPTATGLGWSTPTAVMSPTARIYYPCSPVPDTTGLYPGTKWVMHTGTALGTQIQATTEPPTYTSVPSLTNTVSPSRNYGVTQAWDHFNVSAYTGSMICVDENGAGFNWTMGSTPLPTTQAFNTVYCIGTIGATAAYWSGAGNAPFFTADEIIQIMNGGYPAQTIYYNYNVYGYTCGQGLAEMGYVPGTGSFTNKTQDIFGTKCNLSSYQVGTVTFSLVASIYNQNVVSTPTVTPIFTPTGTPFPCQSLPDYSGTPIADFPPITYSYGGCTSILPAVGIPFNGLFGIPSVLFPGFGVCIMWVNLDAHFLGFSLATLVSSMIILGFGFAIYNEFRS